jgi:hypothetical protein
VRDLRNDKFERLRKEADSKQIEKLRNHPHMPEDFDWRDYLYMNPILRDKGIDREVLAMRHWLKQGRRQGLLYKVDETRVEEINVFFPSKVKDLKDSTAFKEFSEEVKENTSKNKKVVYTCISGKYDNLKEIHDYDDSWDYICFTNSVSPGFRGHWEVREIPPVLAGLDQTRKARALKVLPHIFLKEYETSIWIDGTIEIMKSPSEFMMDNTSPSDILAISYHPDRCCVYEEKEACLRFSKDDPKILNKQVKKYKEEDYPENWGMVQSGIIYRKNLPEVQEFCNLWWEQILRFSKRDQLSFNYVLWKNPIKIKPLKPSIICSSYFWLWTHNDNEPRRAKIRKSYDTIQNFVNGEPI